MDRRINSLQDKAEQPEIYAWVTPADLYRKLTTAMRYLYSYILTNAGQSSAHT